jgi:crotonobetainyl-CoA:carnitine CoA-transferase CaiB-like acyl-CoA transferase
MGNRSINAAPHGVFRCLGEERWCAIAVYNDEEWNILCREMGHPELSKDPRFSNQEARQENEDILEEIIERWTSRHSAEEVMNQLQAVGVPASIVANGHDLIEDPQLKHRNYYERLEHPAMGLSIHAGWPTKLSETPYQLRYCPNIGEHNEFVCCQLLGMSDEEFIELMEQGVFE